MIPRKRLQILLYVLRIYFVFGDGDPESENLQFLDSKIGSGLGMSSELENFNYTDKEKIPLHTEETTETIKFTSVETSISEEAKNEIKTNKIEDGKFGSTTSGNEIHTSEESKEFEGSDDFKIKTRNVRVINSSLDSITISWIVKSFFVPGYRIEWYTKGFSDYGSNISTLATYTINNLKPCSNYAIIITEDSEEDVNNSNKQTILNGSTTSTVPGPVQNLTIVATTDSVNISWCPPIENTECVTKYMIEVFNQNHSISTINTINTFRVVKELDPCTEYKFVVKAVGEAGLSKEENKSMTTGFDKPGKPINLEAVAEEEKSLKIFWDPPETGATCIKKYRVTLNTEIPIGKPTTPITKHTKSNETEIIFDKLFPCTSYTVQINSVGVDNGDSELERIRSPPTKESVAEPPKKATRPDPTKNSITLFWNIGNKNNCTLESVVVVCNSTGTDGEGYIPQNGTGISNEIIIDQFFNRNVNMTVLNLSPYTNYECVARTNNSAGLSEESKIVNVTTLEDVPSAPELNVTNVTDSKYTFNWIKPKFLPGIIRSYEISLSWEPLFPIPDYCITEKIKNVTVADGTLLNYTYEKGSPFSNYTVQIRAKTGEGFGNWSDQVYFISKIGLPSPVTNFNYKTEPNQNDPNVLNTILQWGLPCASNGQVELFNISYHGKRKDFEDHNYVKIMKITNEVNKNDIYILNDLGELRPSYSYTFLVTAKIKNSTELGSALQYVAEYPAGIPSQPDVEYVKMITIDPQKATRTTTSAAILLPIFPETNGPIQYYAIMVSQMGYNKPTSTRFDLKNEKWPNASCWQESKGKDFTITYQATKPKWDPNPTHVVDYGHIKAVKFILGSDIDCKELSENTDSRLYCNGPLKPGTWYHVRMRAYTNSAYSDSAAFIVKTNAEMNVPIIIGIVFGIMILGILTTLLLLVRRCSLQAVLRRFLHSDMPGSPVPSPLTRRKFISHCQQLADNPGKLSNEFQLLQTLSLDLQMPTNAACLQANRKKNRYSDILPYDFSRVKLDVIDNDPNTDYINASFITGYTGEEEYIACQGPKEETTYDFWRMVDQYDVKIIVMLTQLFEKGKEKCHQYYPVIRETFNYEKMSIRCTSEFDYRTCTQRTLVLQKDDKKRSIMHLSFKDWPDHDVPEDFDPMINFCQIMRRHITANKGLVVIHCSAGIGRTGTLIAIDMLMQSLRDNRKLDVFGTVYRLRRHRLNMVQRESQYAYIYNCIRQVLKNPYILKNCKPPPVDPIHKNNNKKKKNSANSNLDIVSNLDSNWRKGSISLSVDSMDTTYEISTSSTLENPTSNGLRYSKSTSALDSKSMDTCVVKSNSHGYVTYDSVKDSSSGSSIVSLNVSDLQGSRRSVYENVTPLFRSRSEQSIDGIDTYMSQRNDVKSKNEPLEKDTSL